MNYIIKKIQDSVIIEKPFPHIIIHNFFEDEDLTKILNNIEIENLNEIEKKYIKVHYPGAKSSKEELTKRPTGVGLVYALKEDYQAKELAGKKVVFNVVINEIREDIKTEINDDFAKSLGLDNLESLKKSVKEQIINQHSIQSRSKIKREILDLLANSVDFDLPNTLVEDEYQSVCRAMKSNQQTVNDQKDKPNDEGMSKSEKDDALTISKRRVRLGLILAEIGRLNNIKVDEKDTQNAMMQELQRYPGREKEILDYFKKNPEAQNQLSGPVFEDKIIDFISELAEVKEKVVSVEDLYKEDDIDIKDELKKEKIKKSKTKVSKKK